MAKFVVPHTPIVLCKICRTMYVPEKMDEQFFEDCPVCGFGMNKKNNTIPIWRYNLIKFWREHTY